MLYSRMHHRYRVVIVHFIGPCCCATITQCKIWVVRIYCTQFTELKVFKIKEIVSFGKFERFSNLEGSLR